LPNSPKIDFKIWDHIIRVWLRDIKRTIRPMYFFLILCVHSFLNYSIVVGKNNNRNRNKQAKEQQQQKQEEKH
jgi:hypothetical protein